MEIHQKFGNVFLEHADEKGKLELIIYKNCILSSGIGDKPSGTISKVCAIEKIMSCERKPV